MKASNKNTPQNRQRWKQDPQAVRADILRVATAEFSARGLSGTRMDELATKTKTSKRMIYYYFGDKNGLYREVLEDAYREVREGEDKLELDELPPAAALRKLVEFTFEHHSANPDFIRLVMIENIHHGQHLQNSDVIRNVNVSAVRKLEKIYRRGVLAGIFREGIQPLQLHWQISALCFFNVSNRATFSLIFGADALTSTDEGTLLEQVVETVMRFTSR